MTRTVVRGGMVAAPDPRPADVVIDGEHVTELVAPGGADTTGAVVIDAGGLLVLPGMVDAHVHFQEPGREEWEGFDSASAAAVAGGVTTVVDMPIDCDPPTVTAALVRAKAAAARRHSRVDVAMWGGLVPASVAELDAMATAGVIGFKAFACPSGWDDFPAVDEPTLRAGLAAAARLELPVAVHCELEAMGHTEASEVAAVRWAAALAADAGARLHVVHVSSAAAVAEARRWAGVTVETCPHYLLLDDTDAAAIGPTAHCFPPLRDRVNQQALWDRVATIDTVASDHSPCPPAEKDGPEPWAGIDGVGLTLPLLLSDGRLGVDDVVRLTTAGARVLDLPGKGALAPGYDADLALVDPFATWTVTGATQRTRHRQSPFAGRLVRGQVVTTMIRGRVVFADGAPGALGHAKVLTGRCADRRPPGGCPPPC